MNENRTPVDHVPSIAAVLKSQSFPTGEKASLKRMALDGPAPLAFHHFILRHIDEQWQGEAWTSEWRSLIGSIAIQRDGGYDPSVPMGKALAEAGFSESRLERLLSSRGETLRHLTLRAARQLASKGGGADWREIANLLFSRKPEIRESVNRRLARNYYKAIQSK